MKLRPENCGITRSISIIGSDAQSPCIASHNRSVSFVKEDARFLHLLGVQLCMRRECRERLTHHRRLAIPTYITARDHDRDHDSNFIKDCLIKIILIYGCHKLITPCEVGGCRKLYGDKLLCVKFKLEI